MEDPEYSEKNRAKERANRSRARRARRRDIMKQMRFNELGPRMLESQDTAETVGNDVNTEFEVATDRLVSALLNGSVVEENILQMSERERVEAIRTILAGEELESEIGDNRMMIEIGAHGISIDLENLVFAVNDARKAWSDANKEEPPSTKSDFQIDSQKFFADRMNDGCCNPEQDCQEDCSKSEDVEILHTGNYYPLRWKVHWLISIERFLEELCEVHSIDSYCDSFESRGETPKFGNYQITEDEIRSAYRITRFITHKETGRKYILKQSIDCDGDPRCDIYHDGRDGEEEDIIHRIREFADKNGPMKGGVCSVSGKFLTRDESIADKIVLSANQKEIIDKHVLTFIENMPTLFERGLPNSRGILIAGPPGTGKTMLCKAIIGATGLSTIFISGDALNRPGNHGAISEVYRMARRISPSIVIIEDIDTVGGQHRQQQSHPFLAEYLNALNGVEENEGVITIATTNLVGELDPALSDRPGRFDVIMRMETPDRELRQSLLESLSSSFNLAEDASIDILSRRSEGLTGAWLREVLITAELNAKQNGSDIIRDIDLERGLEEVNCRRETCREPTEISIPNCSTMSELYT